MALTSTADRLIVHDAVRHRSTRICAVSLSALYAPVPAGSAINVNHAGYPFLFAILVFRAVRSASTSPLLASLHIADGMSVGPFR